ncbi:MAG: tetratricopeptide repeat protein [Lysobacterales bacterium]
MNKLIDRFVLIAALLTSPAAMASDDIDPVALQSLIDAGKSKAVVSQMESRLKNGPATAQAHYWAAEGQLAQIDAASTFRKLGLARASKKHLLAALELEPSHVPANRTLGQFYLQAPAIAGGSTKLAKAQADALMAMDKAAALRLKADIAQANDDPEAAIAYNRQALAAGQWDWEYQYSLVIQAVHHQVADATSLLDEAERNVRQHAAENLQALRRIDYQRGKYAALSGKALAAGHAGLSRYLTYQPLADDPDLVWAQFRLAQVERQRGDGADANARLVRLEAAEVDKDLGFALQDERRWHYTD